MKPNFSIFFSRTFWTIVAMAIVGGGNAVLPVIPPQAAAILTVMLGLLASYLHVNPSQNYNTGSIK